MKITFNRGFNCILAKITVYKNAQEMAVCSTGKDYCEFDAKEGDDIVLKLTTVGTFVPTVVNFTCPKSNTIYFGPTMACRIWEIFNFKVFPYLSLLFLVLKSTITSNAYDWFCTCMIVLTALSLICFQICIKIPFMWKKIFRLIYL